MLSRQTTQTDEAFVLEVENHARGLLGPFDYAEYRTIYAHFGSNWRLNRVFTFFNLKYSPRAVPAAPKPRKQRADTMGGGGGGDGKRSEVASAGQPPKRIRVSRKAEKGRLPLPNEAGAIAVLSKVVAAAARSKLSDPLAVPARKRAPAPKAAGPQDSGKLLCVC